MTFNEWLEKEKGFSLRASHDAMSRLKRVQKLLETNEITAKSLDKLEKVAEFKTLSMSVKSQLRRTIRLYNEYTLNS